MSNDPTGYAMADKFRKVQAVLHDRAEAVIEAWYGAVQASYLREHKRLPGSTRTARLRKKRRKAIQRWLVREMESERLWE